jgi:hypothetical protein
MARDQGVSVDRRGGRDGDGCDRLGSGRGGAGQQGEGEKGGAETHYFASAFSPKPAPFHPYQATTAKQTAGIRKALLSP